MKAKIYIQDLEAPEMKGAHLATVKIKEIPFMPNREVVNNAITPLKEWLQKTYNTSLIVSIGGDKYFGQFVELWHHQNSKEQSEANAKLIAAAPELLEALEELMSIVKIHSNGNKNNFAWAEMDFAKEAIKKAKGE